MADEIVKLEKQVPSTDPRRHYVSSWVGTAVGALLKGLPKWIDDIERDFTTDTYEKMMNDSAAGGAVDILRASVLEPGLTIVPCVEAPKAWKKDTKQAAEHQKAKDVHEFVMSCIESLEFGEASLEDFLWEAMLAIPFGSSVAEQLYDVEGSRYILKDIIVKPRSNIQFVVDESNKLVGLNAKKPGESGLITLSSGVDPEKLIDRSKFAILVFGSRYRDPRGASAFRRAYGVWYIKTQIWPAFFKYLLQFGTPSLIGYTPEGEVDDGNYIDPDGEAKQAPPEQIMMETLQAFFGNGSVAALKGGSKVDLLQSSGEGQAFRDGIELFNQEITRAVLLQTRATMEAQHGSKADSETSQDILDVLVLRLRSWVCRFVRRDILANIVRINLGESKVKYTPKALLSKPKEADFEKRASGISSLKLAGWFEGAEDLLPEADEMLGFTPRDMTVYRASVEADREAQALQTKEMGRLFDPTDPTAKEPPATK